MQAGTNNNELGDRRTYRLKSIHLTELRPSALGDQQQVTPEHPTHSLAIGYVCWLFGFTGAHRFYYGKQISGTIWFFTLGLFGIGWLIDLFLMPSLNASADRRYHSGPLDYTVGWLLLTYLGLFGIHRFYTGRWITGIIWLCTGGLLGIGLLYDLWTMNGQIDEQNRLALSGGLTAA